MDSTIVFGLQGHTRKFFFTANVFWSLFLLQSPPTQNAFISLESINDHKFHCNSLGMTVKGTMGLVASKLAAVNWQSPAAAVWSKHRSTRPNVYLHKNKRCAGN
jgi:hypothetical protein